MNVRKLFAQLLMAGVLVTTACGQKHVRHHPPPNHEPGRTSELDVGSPVAARWSDGKWYFGHVATSGEGTYGIDYATGDFGSVGTGEVLPISHPHQIVPGAHVLALWKEHSMYPGVVLSVTNGKARVRWDDGDLPLDVPFDRIAVIGSVGTMPPPASVAGPLGVGSHVAAKWKDGNWWYGAIGRVEDDGYVINYADGEVLKVAPNGVLPIAAPGSLQIGTHVLAVWKGAQMYPGVITALQPTSATVRWDDGDVPLVVPFERIALH